MANHKRKRPKSRRAGCLSCKPHKHERNGNPPRHGVKRQTPVYEVLESRPGFVFARVTFK